MAAKRVVTEAERRARLGLRHRLCPESRAGNGVSPSVESVVDDLVVLHATDPATVYLSVAARLPGVAVADIEAALFERRTMLRTLAMRRTLFVPTTELAPTVEWSSSIDVAAAERKRLTKFLVDSDIADPVGWLDDAAAEVIDALPPEGLPARDITAAVPRLATRILMGAGTKHPVEAGATSRTLGLLAVERHIVRGRQAGDWTGRQYRWHRRDRWWVDHDPDIDQLDQFEASVGLVRNWLARFGPATVADIKWWTGWTMTKTRAALAELDTVEVELDGALAGQTGVLLADDRAPVDSVGPWAALLPSLDPSAMGWTDRDWYLGDHRDPLFDRNGNIGPTVWVDGRIVGGWSQDPDGAVVVELLEPVGDEHRALIEEQRERVAAFIGDVVVKPSFPTPLQKRLSAGS